MFRTMLATLTVALMLAPAASALAHLDIPVPATGDARPGAGQWIVGFYQMPDVKEGDLYLGEPIVSTSPELAFITIKPADLGLFQVKAKLDDNVKWIETDVSDAHLDYTPNDYYWNNQYNWGVKKIGATTAWDRTLGSTSIKDGHIDSGMVIGHEDLSGSRFLAGWDYYGNDGTPEDTSGCSWHGSHTMGTVAATINNAKGFPGLAQITEIPIKIFGGGACAATSVTGIANAINYAGNQGAHVSSNSWGGGAYSSAIDGAITTARGKGVIFVAAAGNGGCTACIGEPWGRQEANVIIVEATDSNDVAATFNSQGWQSDVSAPGVNIGSAGGPGNSYYVMSGTSMATPHVAGVAALIKTLNPSFTELQVEARLKSTAVDLGPVGEDDNYGAGRIDAAAAVY